MTAPQDKVPVQALQPLRCEGVTRARREYFHTTPEIAKHLQRHGFLRLVNERVNWQTAPGRELRLLDPAPGPWTRVVACLNVWNDRPALAVTLPRWFPHVDHLIAVDGAYQSTGEPGPSTDGTLEFLRSLPAEKVTIIERATAWPDQVTKRNTYLELGRPGDLLFIVDADEFVDDAPRIRQAPVLDVGWVTVTSSLYQRKYGQPRVIRWQEGLHYDQRHHWLYVGDRLLASHQYGGLALHRLLPIAMTNARGLHHTPERESAKRRAQMTQYVQESSRVAVQATKASDRLTGGRESLQILQLTSYDAGGVVCRLHTALNATTPHASMYARYGGDNPFRYPQQFECTEITEPMIIEAARTADVVHVHLQWNLLERLHVKTKAALVIHHHGTLLRRMHQYHAISDQQAALKLISNWELTRYGDDFHWLPNPVPIQEYRALQATLPPRTDQEFVVGHSPSKRAIKGTEVFLNVCERLRAGGFPIRAELIEGVSYAESVRRKAGCDAFFDSFALGIQCSGLEAAAFGMPVIAGDAYVAEQYRRHLGDCPYTFAETEEELEAVLVRMLEDPAYRSQEGELVTKYVETHHDEAAVAIRYLDLLDLTTHWRSVMSLHKPVRPDPLSEVAAPLSHVQPEHLIQPVRLPDSRAAASITQEV